MEESLARYCSRIPTTLGRVSENDALLLLMHAYQNVQSKYPDRDALPSYERFTRLLSRKGHIAQLPHVRVYSTERGEVTFSRWRAVLAARWEHLKREYERARR
jgi:hypothetical protein